MSSSYAGGEVHNYGPYVPFGGTTDVSEVRGIPEPFPEGSLYENVSLDEMRMFSEALDKMNNVGLHIKEPNKWKGGKKKRRTS